MKQIFLEFTKFLRKLSCRRHHEFILKKFVTVQVINFGLLNLHPSSIPLREGIVPSSHFSGDVGDEVKEDPITIREPSHCT